MSSLIAEHRGYLSDAARLAAFRQAIAQAVKPGDTVLDLGSGTGVLGFMAVQAGASRVYAVDATSMLAVGRSAARANGLDDRITFLKEHALRVQLPERVDVVVADQLGPFGTEAGAFRLFADARRRHLTPTGTMIPRRIRLVAAPATAETLWSDVAFWDDHVAGYDLTAMASLSRHNPYYTTSDPDDLVGPPVVLADLDPGDADATPISTTATLPVTAAGTVHGVAGWFVAELAPGLEITNSPLGPDRLDRSHVFLPLSQPVAVEPGETITLALHVRPDDAQSRWDVAVRAADGTVRSRSRHSSTEGVPLCREDLMRTHPEHVPTLSARGAARATVLSLVDGRRPLRELEAAVFERHRAEFATASAAAAFVADTLARDAT